MFLPQTRYAFWRAKPAIIQKEIKHMMFATTITLIGVVLAFLVFLYETNRRQFAEMRAQFAALAQKVDDQAARIDAQGARLDKRIDDQGVSLGASIDAQGARLEARIDAQGAIIDAQGAYLGARIDALGARFDELRSDHNNMHRELAELKTRFELSAS